MGVLYILQIASLSIVVSVILSLFILLKVPPLVETPMIRKSEPSFYYLTRMARELFGLKEKPTVLAGTGQGFNTSRYKLVATSVGALRLALLTSGSEVYVVREGESLNGSVVKRIEKDLIILSTRGGEVIIKFPQPTAPDGSNRSVSTPSPIKREGSTVVVSRRELERLTSDPGIMFNQVRLVPYIQNGRTKGFKFEWIQPNSLLAKAGLKPGDILIAINNMQITSGEDAFRILQVLRNETSFKISIIRGGREMDLTLRVE